MAVVRPFAALRYASTYGVDISPVVCPPYDVFNDGQRAALVERDAHNAVLLELPEGAHDPQAPGNRYETGAARWSAWRNEGVLVADDEPTIYVLEQRYELAGRRIRRRAFIAAVDAEPFEAGVVLPHERTLPKARADRINLTRATAANFSQVFGLFSDSEGATNELFATAMSGVPIACATDTDGVESVLWAITDQAMQERLAVILADRQIFIADGHHRYETAVAYREERTAEDTDRVEGDWRPYDSVMMALVNMDDPDLVVLPTHRVARAESAFDPSSFWTALGKHFDVTDVEGHPTGALDAVGDRPAFLVRVAGDSRIRLAALRPGLDAAAVMPTDNSDDWKRLDVAVLLELILWPLLGIHPDHPDTLERITFPKDAHEAMRMTESGWDAAFVLRSTRMDQLRAVSLNGEKMPQKSTYFYPKLLSGLLFRSMQG